MVHYLGEIKAGIQASNHITSTVKSKERINIFLLPFHAQLAFLLLAVRAQPMGWCCWDSAEYTNNQ